MNWPAYEQYKDSGAPWLGEIPHGWSVTFVKNRFDIVLGKMLNAGAASKEGVEVPYLRAGNIQPHGVDLSEVKLTPFTPAEQKALNLRRGDLVVVEGGAGYGRSAVLSEDLDGWGFQNHVMRVRPSRDDLNGYLNYVIQSLNANGHIASLSNHATIPSLSSDQLGRIAVPIPDLGTQLEIVDFLNRETVKIDALIAKQEQLIATLREDRAATIAQAVTKGLDLDVEMKDSGIERLGEVPEHWTVPQVGWHTTVGNGATPARDNQSYWADGTIPWLNSGHVNRDRITDADQFVTDTAARECHLPMVPAGSVLVGLTGQGKTRGMASLLAVSSTINQHLGYLTPDSPQLDVLYLLYTIQTAYDHLRELSEENGSTKGGLTCAALRKLRVPLPPLEEQHAIAEFIATCRAQVNALIGKSTETIEILREYRSALITDAVTGKIDVRGVP